MAGKGKTTANKGKLLSFWKKKEPKDPVENETSIKTVNRDPGVFNGKDNLAFEASNTSQGSLFTVTTTDERKQIFGEDENVERGNWTGRFDFLLSMLGYAVGLGNVWRFPYLCYRNGGGAFLLPFVIMMAIIGIPLFLLESALGQYCSSGPMTCWRFAPLFKGVGVAMVIVSALTSIYYNMILAWAQYYLFASFTSELPWMSCTQPWSTRDCSMLLPLVKTCDGIAYPNGTCYNKQEFVGIWNNTLFTNVTGRRRISSSEEYWNSQVLNIADKIDDFGAPKWDLVLNLMLAWIICFFCLIKGIKSTGKVVYFTAIFPYVVLLILFFRGVTLPNAIEGIKYFIVPEFSKLLDARVWKDAANQIFFSMGIAGGGLMTLSSYNRFHNNILRDTLIVSLGDTLTCIFAGFVIFSFLGFMAGEMNVPVSEVAKDGAGLAFIVYPEAVSSLPAPPVWSILFFFMLILLGLDSQFAMLETVLTGLMDQFPHLRPKKTYIIAAICAALFLIGLPLTCPGGMYLLQMMDSYVGGWTLMVIGFFELVAVVFVYGADRFYSDMELMMGKRPNIFWKICWYGLSPVTILFIFFFTWVDYEASTYGDYVYPGWADAIGWIMAFGSIMAIPVFMFIKINNEIDSNTLLGKLRLLTMPSVEWGPALPKHRQLVDYVDNFEVDPWAAMRPKAYYNNGFSDQLTSSSKAMSDISLSRSGISGYSGASVATQASYESTV
ncbi:sodium- and chloride-dependent glycine transporter 1 [Patella vulgata]|uniref:sodium- and chloride-dependent glycine transporter 1 n=1 Tax=Patella vulgata TaxID=6465 RepID=UPI00217FC282|nr:sodium- and chloride-dependent glycine transporter 1 [Patella vulgata]